ncbi:MAG TPA: hypothetical protein VJ828_06215 [Lacipirellulaceae bacterium]|nr:hypothetical protein [Lacipirellulaceae bacterium]
MPVEQLTPRRAPRPSSESKLVKYDEYIDTQIKNTRRAVKLVDLATALVLLSTGVLAFLLAAAVVEHWLLPGGFSVAVRSLLFALLVGGVGYFAYRRLWPLVRRAINPVYAAQTIEQSSPTLKNSLINLLLFRQHRAEISDAVYKTLEEQAAQRLTRVPVDAAVDRSVLIRVGYGLLAVVAIAALYKLFSPKDPFVAAERVLMPWRDIVPASRVTIRDIRPGPLTVSRGESLTVSAEVRGISESDPVLLRYTTNDGQAVDKPLEMKLAEGGLRFEGRLPDEASAGNKLGLTQSFTYHIEAGDARSLDYDVTVVPAPSILVKRVDYDFPDYTGYLDRSVDDLGDIRAIEGTRVTVHARANGPIKEAQVDFDADGRRDLTMTANGADARASFRLELREDRQTPRHASYVLRFDNVDGRPNRDPVKHPIVVDPDLVPETSIVLPQEKTLDVRLNDTVTIEAEAIDPDFALAEVRLRGEVAGRNVIDEPLLARAHTGRFTGRYQLKPSAKGLKAGDVVQYWVTAKDNRAPTANLSESERKLIRIVAPDAGQPPPDPNAQPQQGDRQQGEQQQREGGQEGEANQAGQRNEGNQDGQAQDGQQQQGGEGKSDSADANNQGEQRDGDPQGSANSANGKSTSADKKNQGKQREGEGSPASGQQGEGAEGAPAGSEQQGNQQGKTSTNKNQQGEQTGAGAAGGDSSQAGSQSAGTRPDQNTAARPSNGATPSDADDAEPSPVSPEGDNDAEAFKRIQKHLERSGELKPNEGAPSGTNKSDRDAQQERQRDKEKGRQGEKQEAPGEQPGTRKGETASADGKNQGEKRNGEAGADSGKEDGTQRNGDSAAATAKNQAQQRDGEPQNQPGERADDQGEGTGAETRQDDLPEDAQQQSRDGGEQEKSPGGEQTATKGEPGAGNQQQSQGAPNSQPEMKPTQKREQTGSDGEQTDNEEPAAGARGKRESDSQGEEGGDKAGGGEEGGGQKTPRDGTGSAGQNQAADEGAGESSEKGTGNTSSSAGDDAVANDRTGQSSGDTPGQGTKQRAGQGEQAGGEAGTEADSARSEQNGEPVNREGGATEGGRPSANNEQKQGDKDPGKQSEGNAGLQNQPSDESAQQPQSQPGEQSSQNGGEQGGAPTGDGGLEGTADSPARSTQGEAPPGDEANLDYARKQTDLVLDKLADQLNKKDVDDQLLKDLGWSEEDLRRFVDRWQQRKNAARQNDQTGKSAERELDEALRSLGLRPGTLQQNIRKDDRQRDLREGFRGPVPAKYREQLQRYNRGVSRAGRDEAGE